MVGFLREHVERAADDASAGADDLGMKAVHVAEGHLREQWCAGRRSIPVDAVIPRAAEVDAAAPLAHVSPCGKNRAGAPCAACRQRDDAELAGVEVRPPTGQ